MHVLSYWTSPKHKFKNKTIKDFKSAIAKHKASTAVWGRREGCETHRSQTHEAHLMGS